MSLENGVPPERKLCLHATTEITPAALVKIALRVRSSYITSSLIRNKRVDEGILPDRLRTAEVEDSVGFTMEPIAELDRMEVVPTTTIMVFIAPARDGSRIVDSIRAGYTKK